MTTTLYASFANMEDAEKATGALMDHGLKASDISLIAHEKYADRYGTHQSTDSEVKAEDRAKSGISTTTAEDAGTGSIAGAGIGLGVGIAAALAAIFLPGVGFVLGGGALAVAIGGAAGATGAGAIAGGAFGYLRDQGVPEDAITTYRHTFDQGGAILAVSIPGDMPRMEAEQIITKYNGSGVNAYGLSAAR